jgi:ubiquinone biosynthesis UbiH/UbiF/VisC/COQ6 family hydroxylase
MSDSATTPDFDLAIAGGGLVGSSLALALAPLGWRIALVEAVAPGGDAHPSFDERTTALANGSVRVFSSLGVWDYMEREATPIRRVHVSDQGRFGSARIDAAEQGLEALGQVLPNRVIGAGLWQGLRRCPTVEVIAPARVLGSEIDGDARVLHFERNGAAHRLRARLVVAADGAHSRVREQAGVGAEHWAYGQTAIVSTMTTQRFHDYVAYERFTPQGPIAVLPLTEGRCGVVWTRRPEEVERLLSLTDPAFLAELQAAFGSGSAGCCRSASARRTRSSFHVRTGTWPSGSPSSATRRRRCIRSPDRDSTSACATPRASPRCWRTRGRPARTTPGWPGRWRRTRSGATRTGVASLPSRTAWYACSRHRSACFAACAVPACSRSTSFPRRRAPWRA